MLVFKNKGDVGTMTKFESNLSAVVEELQNKDVLQDAKDVDLQKQITAEITTRTNADETESRARASAVKDLQAQIDALKKTGCSPSGIVEYFAMTTAPEGWLKADGSAVSRTGYASLFAAIGTLYGAGDGSTTFNVPDLRGEFIRGFDDGRGVDTGRKLGSLQTDGFKNHTHSLSIGKTAQDGNSWWHDTWSFTSGNYYASTTPNVLATGGTETRPRNISLLACIKY